MEQLLIAVSVYREPADRNAILFQLGEHDWTAARAPDRRGPAPPYQAPADLPELVASCVAAELLSASAASADQAAASWIVDPWLAAELHRQLEAVGRRAELAAAHRRAAEYWQWRSAAWPQGRRQDLHDLLEARHHLFSAGDGEQASEVTHVVCAQLHAWGDLGREAELIQATLDRLPGGSASWARWMHELGAIYQVRGDHDGAQRCYSSSAETFAILGDRRGLARGHHSLGVLAQAQGDYRRAERHYRKSSAAEKKAGVVRASDAGREASMPAGARSPAGDAAPADPRTSADDPGADDTGADNAGADDTGADDTGADNAGAGDPGTDDTGADNAGPGGPGASLQADRAQSGGKDQRGEAGARPAIRLVVTGEASQPTLHLEAEVHKPSAPELVPASELPPTIPAGKVTRRPEPARSPAMPLTAAVAGNTAAHGASITSSRFRGRTGAILLVLGLVAGAIAILGALLARPGVQIHSHGPFLSGATSPGAVRQAAAVWVASQVSRSAVVGCDPAMCAALEDHGVPSGDLLALGTGGPADPLASNVVLATAALRSEFGARLVSAYAPEVLASFGSGTSGIEVRAVAPDGVPAFLAAIRSDLQARRQFGASLSRNKHLLVSAQERAQLAAGKVDSRLLATLATIADIQPLRIVAFGDAGPGADSSVPLRSAEVAPTGRAGAGWARSLLMFFNAQQLPFRPATAVLTSLRGYPQVLRIQYACPSPLGLLTASGGTSEVSSTHE